MSTSNFQDANFQGANFQGANFQPANLHRRDTLGFGSWDLGS